jgi:hypothetical protein
MHLQQVSTPTYTTPTTAAQPGTTAKLDTGFTDFTGISKIGGELYLGLTSGYDWGGGNVNSTINSMQINATVGSIGLDKAGSFGISGEWFFFPSTFGSATPGQFQVLNAAVSSPTIPVGDWVVSLDNTGAATSSTIAPKGVSDYCYKVDCSGENRWGDFTSLVQDPTSGASATTMWSAGIYATGLNDWATRMTQITIS